MKTRLCILLIATVSLLASCEKNSNSNPSRGARVIDFKNVGVTDAQSIFIAETSSTRAGLTRQEGTGVTPDMMTDPKLFKFTASGESYEVEFRDANNEVIKVETTGFVNLFGEFLGLGIRYPRRTDSLSLTEPGNIKEKYLLIDRRNGAVFDTEVLEEYAPGQFIEQQTPFYERLADLISDSFVWGMSLEDLNLKKDKDGSVYNLYSSELFKIYRSGDGIEVRQSPLNVSGSWLLNPNGDIWYDYYCLTADGEYIDSDDEMDDYSCFVKESAPGNFFEYRCWYDDELSEFQNDVYQMCVYKYTPGTAKLERSVDLQKTLDREINPGPAPLTIIKNRMIIISRDTYYDGVLSYPPIYVIDENNNISTYENNENTFPRTSGTWPNRCVRITKNYIYDCADDWGDRSDPDRNKIRAFDVMDGSVTTVYEAPANCTITSWTVTAGDAMTFTMLEGATGNPVTIVREADGTVTEYREERGQTIYKLERLS